MRSGPPNIAMLAGVARSLKELKDEVVFVGGATIDLFLEDPAAPATRATDDVDCVVELATLGAYHELEERLRRLGFKNAQEEGIICRWKIGEVKVDVMPADGGILNFKNRWYPEGIANSVSVAVDQGLEARIFTLPYLVASKLEAFNGRGAGDFQGSQDLEDIVAVLDGCPDALERIANAPETVRLYLAKAFAGLLAKERFVESVPGHIQESGRGERVLGVMRELARLA